MKKGIKILQLNILDQNIRQIFIFTKKCNFLVRINFCIIQFKINVDNIPDLEDLVRLIQTIENVNQQILFENKYLKEETARAKATILKLIEENTLLHKELKNITVLEILSEFQQLGIDALRSADNSQINNEQIKNKKYNDFKNFMIDF